MAAATSSPRLLPSPEENDFVRFLSAARKSSAGPIVHSRITRAWRLAALTAVLTAGGLAGAGNATAATATPVAAAGHPIHKSAATGAATGHTLAKRDKGRHGAAAAAAQVGTAAAAAAPAYRRACATAKRPGKMSCLVLVSTAAQSRQSPAGPDAAPTGVGFGPASLQAAYKLPSATAGSGQTVAIVDAFDDPSAAANLATYRKAWGLPACGTGCFKKVNQAGKASPLPAPAHSNGWATEESLDLDMVSAICPKCHILLVEAKNAGTANLGAAVNTAVALGAKYVSNSYGGPEAANDPTLDTKYYKHPGVAVTASAGDNGFGLSYPAASQYVTSVGGTSLSASTNTRGWTERVWGTASGGTGTGSGCSADSAKPSWQTDTGCTKRTDNDVAAVANPSTGVAIYDTYDQHGWLEVGGTSASSPIIASVFALSGPPAAGTYPSSYLYAHPGSLFDVTAGANGTCSPVYLCHAEAGYDGPTGLGTPEGTAGFSSSSPVTVTAPRDQAGTVGTAVKTLRVKAADVTAGSSLRYKAVGLPAGLRINASTGRIKGTPAVAGTAVVQVIVTDSAGASGVAAFNWTVAAAGGSGGGAGGSGGGSGGAGGACAPGQLLGNPGFEAAKQAPWTSSPNVVNKADGNVTAHAGKKVAWLAGYGVAMNQTLAQTVTIPASCTTAKFSFWLDIQSDALKGKAGDTLTLQVVNSGGAVAATLGTMTNLQATSKYKQYSYSLKRYIGQTITLKFTSKETLAGNVTSFLEDDNALTVS
jgi:hypothetical protein